MFDDASPEEYDDGYDEAPDEGDGETRPAVFVTTREPVQLSVTHLTDPRAPEESALGAFIDGRLIARSAMPREAVDRLIGLKLFDEPVPVGLFAYEASPGLQCRLFALIPRDAMEAAAHADEPWKASVPSYETGQHTDHEPDEDGARPFETILLGHIVRFAKDRRHPDDLAAEAVDILQKIIGSRESLRDADARAIDDLLDSL
jgi:hypothetical protein